jgi:hypothetical protein
MKAFKYGIAAGLALISVQSFAEVLVYIENDTPSICKLENKELKHGLLYTFPPVRVAPSQVGAFRMMDSGFRGPEITLYFNCGGKKINVTCQENLGFLWAGDVSAKLDYADPGITAHYQLEAGSFLWNQIGVM